MDRDHAPSPPSGRVGQLLTVVAWLGLAALVWLPRGLQLDRAVTTDESIWLARSGNFYQALANGDLSKTFQYAHPGVTTMWAGAIAIRLEYPEYADVAPDSVRPWNNSILPVLEEAGIDPLEMLVAARQVIVLFTTLGMVALGWYAVRLLGPGPGLLGSALLALDPFHVALSQLLHVDALVSVLATLSAAAWLAYLLRGRHRRDLIVAGIALGLAGLTRSTAMVVVPMMAVSLLIESRPVERAGAERRAGVKRFRPLLAVGVIALATMVIVWPALWVSPIGTIGKVIEGTRNLAEEAHARAIFFDGRIYDGVDPGIRFYPTAMLWRTTPAVLIGLLAAVVVGLSAAGTARGGPRPSAEARAAGYLALLSLLTVLLLSASAKKFDRYVVLALPALILVAAWGYGAAGRGIARRLRGRGPRLATAALATGALLVVGGTAAETLAVRPYPLSYYDPLLGGAAGARGAMMVGAGEGFDQIAATLDALPDVAEARIVTSAWEAPISYFTDVAAIHLVDLTTARGIGTWLMADYYIWDITSDQRGAVPRVIQDHIAGLTPLETVRLNGVKYAAVYDLRGVGIPAPLAAAARPVSGGGDLRLVTTALPTGPLASGAALAATMYLTGDTVGDERVPLRLTLIDAKGVQRASGGYGFVRTSERTTVFSIRRDIQVPSYLPSGTYTVVARFGGAENASTLVLGQVEIVRPP